MTTSPGGGSSRADDALWESELTFTPAETMAISGMRAQRGESTDCKTCHFPGCSKAGQVLASRQSRDRHVQGTHLKTLDFECDICTAKNPAKPKVIKRWDAYIRHMRNVHNVEVPEGKRGKK